MLTFPKYVLITPARNEAQFIALTLKSVISQTVRPLKWVIVSDGSTDGTDEIVSRYLADNPWIELVRMPERRERNFAGKVLAFNAGYAKVKAMQFDAVGNVDADASFDEDYFAFLLQKLTENASLGLIGTAFRETARGFYDYRFVSIEHVTGICQLFRRQCFEDIGGYTPVKGGAIDRIANIAARMKGWKTRTFTEKMYVHHRAMSSAEQGVLKARFKDGAKDYAVGSHPVWELFRTVYQMRNAPFVIGGLSLLLGYTWSFVSGARRPVSEEMTRFLRQEQMHRLKEFLAGKTLRTRA
jgi:glycosyltransferase involved in cell wall biosynthesis